MDAGEDDFPSHHYFNMPLLKEKEEIIGFGMSIKQSGSAAAVTNVEVKLIEKNGTK